jgi:uncharacterized protein YbbC (DUF1343 family)
LVYPGTCLFEATVLSEGRGTLEPFKRIGGPEINGEALALHLNSLGLPGALFEAARFTPRSIPGMATNPKLADVPLEGVYLTIVHPIEYRPLETGVFLLDAFLDQIPPNNRTTLLREEWMGRLAGTQRLYTLLARDSDPEEIIASWSDEVAAFRERRSKYLLY